MRSSTAFRREPSDRRPPVPAPGMRPGSPRSAPGIRSGAPGSALHFAALAAGVLLAALACGDAGRSEPAVVEAEELEMQVSLEPATSRVGENRLRIALRDAEGDPVEGAEIRARVHMHAMGAMPAMGGPVRVEETDPGVYTGEFELDMGSTWQVEIRAEAPDGSEVAAEGSLTVGSPGLRLTAVGGPAPPDAPRAEGAEEDHAAHAGEGAPADGAPSAPDAERHPGELSLPPERIQRIGVRTTTAERVPLTTAIRALGLVTWDETALSDVSLKVRGWVETLEVDAVGDPVRAGQVLFTLYSPELYSAQEEYLQALRSQGRARGTEAPDRADYLVRSARTRLRLWDIGEEELDAIARRGAPLEHLAIRAPRTGYVVEKRVVEGSGFEAGQKLYRIAPLDRVWIEAEIYEAEVGLVEEGQRATVELPYAPGVRREARVAYVLPALSREARTARVRLELANPELRLRPDMYANVWIQVERGERLVVPQSAVLHAGDRSFVFRALGEGRFRPQEVEVGLRAGERVEILAGLEPGAAVVSSGTFLIASESRLRAALEQW